MRQNWQGSLSPWLAMAGRVAILGIGSPLNSDDAAGMLLIEDLQTRGLNPEKVLLLAGSSAPENFIGEICGFDPDLLLAVDAAWLGLSPGQVALLEGEELDGADFSTHMLPFSVTLRYLQQWGIKNAQLLGIQPLSTEFGFTLSEPVGQAVRQVADFLAHTLP